MSAKGLARRYADALFRTANKAEKVSEVESDLGLITYSIETVSSLWDMLTHPLISAEDKKKLLSSLFDEKVQPLTMDFLHLIIDKQRESILDEIEQEYVSIANESRNIAPVLVTSAKPLTSEQITKLQSKLEKFTGKTVKLQFEEDINLIGGLTIRIGDSVIDGSVKGYLASMRNQLLGE